MTRLPLPAPGAPGQRPAEVKWKPIYGPIRAEPAASFGGQSNAEPQHIGIRVPEAELPRQRPNSIEIVGRELAHPHVNQVSARHQFAPCSLRALLAHYTRHNPCAQVKSQQTHRDGLPSCPRTPTRGTRTRQICARIFSRMESERPVCGGCQMHPQGRYESTVLRARRLTAVQLGRHHNPDLAGRPGRLPWRSSSSPPLPSPTTSSSSARGLPKLRSAATLRRLRTASIIVLGSSRS